MRGRDGTGGAPHVGREERHRAQLWGAGAKAIYDLDLPKQQGPTEAKKFRAGKPGMG